MPQPTPLNAQNVSFQEPERSWRSPPPPSQPNNTNNQRPGYDYSYSKTSSVGTPGANVPVFTDPFDLFNSLFGDVHALFGQLGTGGPGDPFSDPFFADPFGAMGMGMGMNNAMGGMGMGGMPGMPGMNQWRQR